MIPSLRPAVGRGKEANSKGGAVTVVPPIGIEQALRAAGDRDSGKLVDVAPANASPSPAVCAELLALNRGPLDDDALLQVKAGLTTQGMTGRQSPAKGFDD